MGACLKSRVDATLLKNTQVTFSENQEREFIFKKFSIFFILNVDN